MRRPALLFFLPVLSAALAMAGCGPSPSPSPETAPAASGGQAELAAPPASIQVIALESLPGTDGASPPVDGGRLVVAVPEKWRLAPRSSQWLVRMQMASGDAYPAIVINGGASTERGPDGEAIERLDASNVEEYAAQLQAQLSRQVNPETLFQPPAPIRIGNRFGVQYSQHVASGGKKLDRTVVVTISSGRRYEVELRTLRGTLPRFRPYAHTVAARMTVLEVEAAEPLSGEEVDE